VPLRTVVGLRCEKLQLSASGVVRHCWRSRGRYLLGLEFGSEIRLDAFLTPNPAATG
jgi:hypothetical protein